MYIYRCHSAVDAISSASRCALLQEPALVFKVPAKSRFFASPAMTASLFQTNSPLRTLVWVNVNLAARLQDVKKRRIHSRRNLSDRDRGNTAQRYVGCSGLLPEQCAGTVWSHGPKRRKHLSERYCGPAGTGGASAGASSDRARIVK